MFKMNIYTKKIDMTLIQIIQILKQIALVQPNIKSATDGSIYDIMNTNPSVKYDVVHFSQTTHQSDETTDYYGLNIFYVSRLEDSLEDNRLQIQSIGKEILDNIIRTFCENWGIDIPTITYTPFTQKFNDLCAGCYCNLRLEIPKEIICADDYVAEVVPGGGIKLQDIGITITQNGLIVVTPDAEYDGIGEIRIETNVPQSTTELQYKEVEYTENGEYVVRPDQDYDGLTEVAVSVDVPDRYDEGYDDGKEDGIAEQKAKLVVTSFTENDTYTRADGWSAVTVNVPQGQGYDEGYADGEAAQKAKLSAITITTNGDYNREDGYSAITVNVPQSGNNQDKTYTFDKSNTQITKSAGGDYYLYGGEIIRPDSGYTGLGSVTARCLADITDLYDSGVTDGEESQRAKMTELTVTENGDYYRIDGYSAVSVNVPVTAYTDLDLIANLQGDYYVIPEGTTHLRNFAFSNACFSSITIPNSVSAIGQSAFANNLCLTAITIPDSVKSIGSVAFNGCSNLQTVNLGSGVTVLESGLFRNCRSLTGITIPSVVENISNLVFDGCSAMTEMVFEGLVPPSLLVTTNSLGSTAYTFPIYVPCQSLEAYQTAFGNAYAPRIQCRPVDMITALTLNVASSIMDYGTATTTYDPATAVTNIHYTSSDPTIAAIDETTGVITVLEEGTVTICAYDSVSGLRDCKTISVDLSSNHNELDFVYLTTAPNQTIVLFIGEDDSGANNFYFFYNNIHSLVVDNVEVGKDAGTIYEYKYDNTCEYRYTFENAGRHNVRFKITSAITALDRLVFSSQGNNQLLEANIRAGITKITFGAFQSQENLTAVTLPDSLVTLGTYAFEYCDLRNLVIPDSCTSLYDDNTQPGSHNGIVFQDNYNLSSVTIGSGITQIPTNTFWQCTGLTSVTMKNPVPPTFIRTEAYVTPGTLLKWIEPFESCPLEHIFVPAESVNAYKAAPGWSDFANIITAIIP